jgi:hypothetical protein
MKEYAAWGGIVSAAFFGPMGLYGTMFVKVRDNIDFMMRMLRHSRD